MDIHRLEVFCKLVELKSFTKAAEAVFLSQPTVSEHIRSLEYRRHNRHISGYSCEHKSLDAQSF